MAVVFLAQAVVGGVVAVADSTRRAEVAAADLVDSVAAADRSAAAAQVAVGRTN